MGLDKAKITALYEKKTKPEGNLYTKRQTLDSLHVDHKAQAILNSHIYFLKKTCKWIPTNYLPTGYKKQPISSHHPCTLV
jgi:hypothetical protein